MMLREFAFKSPNFKNGAFNSFLLITTNFPSSLLCNLAIPTLPGFHTAIPLLFPSPTPPLPSFPTHHLSADASPLPIHRPQLWSHQNLSNAFQWNSMLTTRIDAGLFDSALSIFSSMLASGTRPDHYTLPLVARAVLAFPGSASIGKAIHSIGIQLGFCSEAFFCNSLIDCYVRCEDVVDARSLFDEMLMRDVVSWTTMISGYVQTGDISESFSMFREMRCSAIEPNSVTLSVILRAFVGKQDADGGRQIHGFAIKRGFGCYELVQNSILTAYTKMFCFKEAKKLFYSMEERTPTSWNILMLGYFSAGDLAKVVECFRHMMAASNPSPETLTLVISTLAKHRDLRAGQQIHGHAVKSGRIDMVLQASFLDLYAKCADLASSFSMLKEIEMSSHSIPWIVMMWAFVRSRQFTQAISLFQRMQAVGFEPNSDALRCLVTAYTHLGALLLGKATHGYLIRHQLSVESEMLETSILNLYAKCGNVIFAQRCFDGMERRDTVAWSSMIQGYAAHGMGLEAMKLFRKMNESGIRPNSITFLSLLSSCSHSGLVGAGCEVFSSMTEKFGIMPELNHITCMVDLLARAGKLIEALNLILSMDVRPDGRIWGALLASCRVHQNVSIGEYAAQRLFELEPDNLGYHIVLSKVHAGGNRWADAESIWKSMDEVEFRARPGASCIEEKGGFSNSFALDHSSHQRTEDIY